MRNPAMVGWGRRNRGRTSTEPKPYASIGDTHVDEAVTELCRMQQRAMTVMTEFKYSLAETLRMIFPDDVIARANAAKGLITPESMAETYTINGANLVLYYDKSPTPTISDGAMAIQPTRAGPLVTLIEEARQVHEQYEDVKQMLRWFNRNATPGGIRYYWPPILKLCPKSPAFVNLQDVPSRYTNPPKMATMAPLIRDTATTMAGAILLSKDVKVRSREQIMLTFNRTTVHRGDYSYETDPVTYYY